MIQIVRQPININQMLESVLDPAAGAMDIFVGVTRNSSRGKKVLALEYEVYTPMALKFLHRIANEAREKWAVRHISIVHRVGRVDVGEASVAIAVSAAHRGEAFDACRWIIDTLKTTVPVWKKECFEGGEVWVGLEGQERSPRDE